MLIYRGKIDYSKYAVNEEFTLILPTTIAIGEPVFAAWQWTETEEGDAKINTFETNVIDRVVMSSPKGFGFTYYNSFYTFDITENDVLPTDLTVTMKDTAAGNTTSSFSLQRYSEFIPVERGLPLPVYPRIYVGKMIYGDFAQQEMFIIVVPDILENDADVYAFWQWTQLYEDNARKVNVNYKSKVSSAKPTDDGRYFEFDVAGTYTLNVDVHEDKDSLTVKLIGKTGINFNSFPLDLSLVDDSPTGQRRKRALSDVTSLVSNDSDEAIYCWLRPSASPLTDQVLAGAGLLLASAGLIALLPEAPFVFGAVAAAVGFAAAAAGAKQAFHTGGDAVGHLLFPKDSFSRRSRGGLISSNNDLHILRVSVQNQNKQLVISTYEKMTIGEDTVWIKNILADQSQFQTLITLTMPEPQTIQVQRMLVIPFLKPGPNFPELNPSGWDRSKVEGSMWTIDGDGNSKWFGGIASPRPESSFRYGSTIFTCDEDVKFVLFQGLTPFATHRVLSLPDHTIVLQLRNRTILDKNINDPGRLFPYTLKTCKNEDALLKIIQENGSLWAYSCAEDGSKVYGFPKDSRWSIVYSGSNRDSVYFPVRNTVPHMAMVPASS
jgi:hypothetical protein